MDNKVYAPVMGFLVFGICLMLYMISQNVMKNLDDPEGYAEKRFIKFCKESVNGDYIKYNKSIRYDGKEVDVWGCFLTTVKGKPKLMIMDSYKNDR